MSTTMSSLPLLEAEQYAVRFSSEWVLGCGCWRIDRDLLFHRIATTHMEDGKLVVKVPDGVKSGMELVISRDRNTSQVVVTVPDDVTMGEEFRVDSSVLRRPMLGRSRTGYLNSKLGKTESA